MNKKILMIEDDANLLYSLQAKFRLAGFEVTIDEGLDEAELYHKIISIKPGFIILDLLLPKINGFDFLKKIKADSETATIPIFIFTNLSDEDSKAKGLNLGADYYLIKSDFSLDEFVEKVKRIMANRTKLA
jgi:DNA-binding response OmpR family regulator